MREIEIAGAQVLRWYRVDNLLAAIVEGSRRKDNGATMKSIDQYKMYELGGRLQHVKDVARRENASAWDQVFALMSAKSSVVELLEGEAMEISFCRDAASELTRLMDACLNALGGSKVNEKEPLEDWQIYQVAKQIDIFEHQLNAEMKRIAAYAVPKRGIFDTERLVSAAEASIPEQLRQVMPEMASTEFRASGRCLAFGLYSASGFHAMRAVETLLRAYHKLFVTTEKSPKTMGEMAKELEDLAKGSRATNGPSVEVVRLLKDVTKFDRNPLMHPNAVLGETDATLLFNRAHGLLIVMALEIAERGPQESSEGIAELPEDASSTAMLTGTDLQPKSKSKQEKSLL